MDEGGSQPLARGALVLTHNRPELLKQCVERVRSQVDLVVILDNASNPPVDTHEFRHYGTIVIHVPDQPPNLARLWNTGMGLFVRLGGFRDLAVLCDDAMVPEGWVMAVTAAMRDTGAAIGCSNPWGTPHAPALKTAPDSDLAGRMPGWAWIVDLEKGLQADERFEWWWNDTDLDWAARAAGGMVMIGGYMVTNERPNEFLARPDLSARSGVDTLNFIEKHGGRPW